MKIITLTVMSYSKKINNFHQITTYHTIFNQDKKYLLLNCNVNLLFRTHIKGKIIRLFGYLKWKHLFSELFV
jgi:hypothetical protein